MVATISFDLLEEIQHLQERDFDALQRLFLLLGSSTDQISFTFHGTMPTT